ncbi:ribonuclease HII [Halobacteroides halobius DSM 5150]|uniref:Ribonuclease HII n=1 Tax=Halobacteroides halobius (strain ATCC 35273 / DSM 5150 / MD-1) TaxID=748449 RepID=L0K5P3_HALHC|nr:ribonuclease HII [Halobacteroides halobius]AGB40607.1 ribonuclease HII [Halobacteroides halobius DSM 5150]
MKVSKLTIKELKEKIEKKDQVSEELIVKLEADSRTGVHKIAQKLRRKEERKKEAKQKFKEMSQYEKKLHQQNYRLIAGIDEAGRGPLAGPVVAAAVILPTDKFILGLDDSKKLNEKKREELFDIIYNQAIDIGVGVVDNQRIDEINILNATYEAMKKAIKDLETNPDYLLIDAEELSDVNIPQQGITRGDSKSISIAAASIIAKVTRDRKLVEYDKEYPHYNFASNKGYGTAEHITALREQGPSPIHRHSFKVVKKST